VISTGLDPCAAAFLPDGVPGEGIVYVVNPGSPALLADVDSGAGCAEGIPDFTLAYGRCADVIPGTEMTALSVHPSRSASTASRRGPRSIMSSRVPTPERSSSRARRRLSYRCPTTSRGCRHRSDSAR